MILILFVVLWEALCFKIHAQLVFDLSLFHTMRKLNVRNLSVKSFLFVIVCDSYFNFVYYVNFNSWNKSNLRPVLVNLWVTFKFYCTVWYYFYLVFSLQLVLCNFFLSDHWSRYSLVTQFLLSLILSRHECGLYFFVIILESLWIAKCYVGVVLSLLMLSFRILNRVGNQTLRLCVSNSKPCNFLSLFHSQGSLLLVVWPEGWELWHKFYNCYQCTKFPFRNMQNHKHRKHRIWQIGSCKPTLPGFLSSLVFAWLCNSLARSRVDWRALNLWVHRSRRLNRLLIIAVRYTGWLRNAVRFCSWTRPPHRGWSMSSDALRHAGSRPELSGWRCWPSRPCHHPAGLPWLRWLRSDSLLVDRSLRVTGLSS